jgi:hypothetical protein
MISLQPYAVNERRTISYIDSNDNFKGVGVNIFIEKSVVQAAACEVGAR